uniref:Uncharacterized protein n=2 Tax=Paramoeba aestuarina TaxID=180227 RepID=A0A7S4PKR4_9EUKA|mmetsp:Transcript_8173/g.12364  ORF Transcript_8173/g.12364 Transcript_8173/m.12364 type:complete len:387 (+) Transcript_8173:126-1286(+)
MIHEFLQFDLNAIVLDKSKEASSKNPDENQFVFNPRHDKFYAKHMLSDWGTVCVEAQGMVEEYQSSVKSTKNKPKDEKSTDADDLRDRISQLPKIKRQAVNMRKHVDVMTEIGKQIRIRNLFDIGALEQDIMRTYAPRDHWRKLREIVECKNASNTRDILRLALLFILRYEAEDGSSLTSETSGFTKAFTNLSVTGSSDDASPKVSAAAVVLELLHSNEIGRSTSLIKIKHFLDRYGSDARCMNQPSKSSRNIFKSVFGVVKSASADQSQSWYTQHKPFVTTLAKLLLEENLPLTDFPSYPTNLTIDEKTLEKTDSRNILIFVVGGVTYTEARVMEEFCAEYTEKSTEKTSSKKSPSKHTTITPNILFGSTNMLTSSALLDQMLNE